MKIQWIYVALMGVTLAASPAARAANPCDAPASITDNVAPLPHVAADLMPDHTLNVLTIGSATIFSPTESLLPLTITGQSLGQSPTVQSLGVAPPKPGEPPALSATAFPIQMARALEASIPGLTVKITVRGGRGMLASEMLDILHRELSTTHYDLVIWQTGTVEAVRNVPMGGFFQTLSDGAAAVAAEGGDLVLVDPQYSRFLHANADVDSYAQALQQTAAQPGVALFHRFELMHYWSTAGQIDLERTPKAMRIATVEQLHACLGQALAHFVTVSAKTAS